MSHDPIMHQSPAADPAQPKSDWSPVPIALIILLALLVFWGMVHLNDHGGGFDTRVYGPYASFKQVDDLQPDTDGPGPIIKRGEIVFNGNCVACHQATGMGSPANGCPPLVGSEWVVGGGPNRIIRLVMHGGIGPISVKGTQYPGTTAMTPFGEVLNDQQIADVLSFVRNNWGNKADIVKPDQVKKIRALYPKHANWTAPELQTISDKD